MPANIAGILPLFALIDLTNAEQTLHWYQLSGRSMMWNWVITPACARLLLSHDRTRACCLDQYGAVTPLNCIDGRWGDAYPCSSPRTIRACMGVAALKEIDDLPRPDGGGDRPQRLRIILVSSVESIKKKGLLGARMTTSWWYWAIVSLSGWVVFLAVLVTTVLAELYIAASYLVVLLLTGVVIRESYGHRARKITEQEQNPYRRLVVAADNFNGGEWTAFIGPSWLVSPLLNRPLNQKDQPTYPRLLQCLLCILVAFQWGLTITACGCQDWNAFVVFAWIVLCALTSSFLYGEHASAKSWLKSNKLRLERKEVELSCRRSMLSLLVALNATTSSKSPSSTTPPSTTPPSTTMSSTTTLSTAPPGTTALSPTPPGTGKTTSTRWIDPILAPSGDRTAWEVALQGCLEKEQWKERIQECLVSGLLFSSPLLRSRY